MSVKSSFCLILLFKNVLAILTCKHTPEEPKSQFIKVLNAY